MTTNEERAREIVDRFSEQGLEFVSERFEDRVTSRGIARGLIAAALDEKDKLIAAAEKKGRSTGELAILAQVKGRIEQARAEGGEGKNA